MKKKAKSKKAVNVQVIERELAQGGMHPAYEMLAVEERHSGVRQDGGEGVESATVTDGRREWRDVKAAG